MLTPRMHLSHDPYRWFLRTVVFLLVFIFLCSLLNVKWAFYPATALFFLALAMIARRPWLKVFLWFLSPHFMFRLMFSELFVFLGRSMALHSIQPMWMYAALHVFYILFFALWSFPFLRQRYRSLVAETMANAKRNTFAMRGGYGVCDRSSFHSLLFRRMAAKHYDQSIMECKYWKGEADAEQQRVSQTSPRASRR